jgi:signal transduction histidine kinase
MEESQDKIILLLLVGGGFLLIFLLLFIYLFNKAYLKRIRKEEQKKAILQLNHQKELTTANILIQEKERQRIALDIHDNLISQLYRVKLLNNNISVNKILKKSIVTARTISHDLSPPLLTETSIKELFLDFLQPFQKAYRIETMFTIDDNIILETYKKLQLFRIFQEVITNINKHAKAKKIEIYFRKSKKYIALIVKDNGIGFQVSKKGLGLQNIELRTQTLKGVYRIKANKKKGTTFSLCIRNEKQH